MGLHYLAVNVYFLFNGSSLQCLLELLASYLFLFKFKRATSKHKRQEEKTQKKKTCEQDKQAMETTIGRR